MHGFLKRFRFSIAAGAVALGAIGAGVATGGPAFASQGSGYQYNDNAQNSWLNGWGGGPAVKVYGGGRVSNNDFLTVSYQGGGYSNLIFEPGTGSGYTGYCISDNGNNSQDAKAALVYCSDNNIPWGANITVGSSGCPSGFVYLYDAHWGGYVGGGVANGSQVYLNNTTKHCFYVQAPS